MNPKISMDFLNSLDMTAVKFGLERINYLLDSLGNPHRGMAVIHVAGSNGKGSVSSFIGSILKAAGYRTGVYTSPHIRNFNERIRINGSVIDDEKLGKIIERIMPISEEMKGVEGIGAPTYFEVTTAAALYHFRKENVDFAVVEVGLGGRLDATNVVNPSVSVITNISMEHSNYLGHDLKSIAREKSGIIKKGCSVVTAAEGEPLGVIQEKARSVGSEVTVIGRDVKISEERVDIRGSSFKVSTGAADYRLFTRLLGRHQLKNASCAVSVAEELAKRGAEIGKESIIRGIRNTEIECRLELIHGNPSIIIDSAHNEDGSSSLRDALDAYFAERGVTFILSVCSDKNVDAMIDVLIRRKDTVIATRHSLAQRSMDPGIIAKKVLKKTRNVHVEEDPARALSLARDVTDKDGLIVIAGSIYLAGDMKSLV